MNEGKAYSVRATDETWLVRFREHALAVAASKSDPKHRAQGIVYAELTEQLAKHHAALLAVYRQRGPLGELDVMGESDAILALCRQISTSLGTLCSAISSSAGPQAAAALMHILAGNLTENMNRTARLLATAKDVTEEPKP
jgi:hypothetical protein